MEGQRQREVGWMSGFRRRLKLSAHWDQATYRPRNRHCFVAGCIEDPRCEGRDAKSFGWAVLQKAASCKTRGQAFFSKNLKRLCLTDPFGCEWTAACFRSLWNGSEHRIQVTLLPLLVLSASWALPFLQCLITNNDYQLIGHSYGCRSLAQGHFLWPG